MCVCVCVCVQSDAYKIHGKELFHNGRISDFCFGSLMYHNGRRQGGDMLSYNEVKPQVTDGFPLHRASNKESVSM